MNGTSDERSPIDTAMGVTLRGTHYDSFVVRVRTEDGDRAGVRGQITHVPTRATAHFANLQGLLSFILAVLERNRRDRRR